jgi:hypothetical protein
MNCPQKCALILLAKQVFTQVISPLVSLVSGSFHEKTELRHFSNLFKVLYIRHFRAGIFKQFMGLGTGKEYLGLSYRPAGLHRLAEFIPWNRFLGSINVSKYGLQHPRPASHTLPAEPVFKTKKCGKDS